MTAGVVTFSNQIGANGGTIARAVAEKLRYRYYEREVIAQAAAEAGVSPDVVAVAAAERAPTFIERMMRRLAAASETEMATPAPPVPRQSILTSDDYRQFIEHVVRELADRGDAVISGHASQAVLRDRPGVLRVLLLGSPEVRAQRLAASQDAPIERARQVVSQSDEQRKDFFRRAYHMDWLDAAVYDVSLNTDRLSVDLARDMVVACAREVP